MAAKVPPMAYDIDSYASLGLLWRTLPVETVEVPSTADLVRVRTCLGARPWPISSAARATSAAASARPTARRRRGCAGALREQW